MKTSIEKIRRYFRSPPPHRVGCLCSGFAPFMFRGQLQAGYCTMIVAVERQRGEPNPWAPWQDEGGEG